MDNGHQMRASPAQKARRGQRDSASDDPKKRRCISSACLPCRKRKSKCDGTTPKCSACAAVYHTECIYDPNSDHRRKGVYKKDLNELKTHHSTLHTLIQAILNYPEDEVASLVLQIRSCESLDAVALAVVERENGQDVAHGPSGHVSTPNKKPARPTLESQLSNNINMGELRLGDGSSTYIGGTSHLLHLEADKAPLGSPVIYIDEPLEEAENPFCSWTTVTTDPELVQHLLSMYFCWHYSFFTTLPKHLFLQEFRRGRPALGSGRKTQYCTPLLVNAMLALGCHFTSWPSARAVKEDSSTAGDHFFKEAKRLIMEGDLHEFPSLTTVQALALMSVREAGCGREAKGWVYSGMSFRMACDLGLNVAVQGENSIDDSEEDARRITFWGCFLFDKCWSNYLGRMPQLPTTNLTVPKFEVFPVEDSENWSAITDSGINQAHSQPSRTRAVALQISKLCEISSDIMNYFYNPIEMGRHRGRQAELEKLSDIHIRLEMWKRELPKELEPKEGGLPHMLVMHMLFQLLYIHLFRPFLKYIPTNSPLPMNISPRKLCSQAAAMISKLLRLYKRSHGLRQVCNICVYITHSACTIHLLNLPDKDAKRDIVHGVKHLEEIAEGWLCARRTLGILSVLARRWKVDIPEEAAAVFARTDNKYGPWNQVCTSKSTFSDSSPTVQPSPSVVDSPSVRLYGTPTHTASSYLPASQTNSLETAYTSTTFDTTTSIAMSLTPRSNTLRRNKSAPHSRLNTSSLSPSPSTPAPTSSHMRQTSMGSSPSHMFGGVDQLIREGQDWIWQDQTQLATDFDSWVPTSVEDLTHWLAGTSGANHFSQTVIAGGGEYALGNPTGDGTADSSSAPVGGVGNEMGGQSGGVNAARVHTVGDFRLGYEPTGIGVGNGSQGFAYDERSWYDYH